MMAIHRLHPGAQRSKLELGFLSQHNAFDRRSFSGTAYFAARALANHPAITLRILGPHRPPRLTDRLWRRKAPAIDPHALDVEGLDAVVGMVATEVLDPFMDVHPDIPVIHITDATPAFLREFYGWRIPDEATRAEQRVAREAARVVYSSKLIADRAAADLAVPSLLADTIPFGVNFERLPETCPDKAPLGPLNLLFVGIDWERKGGDIAVAALDRLLAQGIPAQLTIVGRCPERHRTHPHITDAGFLNKNRPKDARRLSELYRQAHLFLLPSRADCTPMVVTEAMAHGTPVVATDIGGVSAQIGGPATGRVLPPHTSPDLWAETIADLTADPMAYAFMVDACFDRGHRTLSWDNWANALEILARDSLATLSGAGAKRMMRA